MNLFFPKLFVSWWFITTKSSKESVNGCFPQKIKLTKRYKHFIVVMIQQLFYSLQSFFFHKQPYLLFVMIHLRALILWVDRISLNLYCDTYLFAFDILSFWSYIYLSVNRMIIMIHALKTWGKYKLLSESNYSATISIYYSLLFPINNKTENCLKIPRNLVNVYSPNPYLACLILFSGAIVHEAVENFTAETMSLRKHN